MAICTHMQNSWQIIKAGLPLPRQMCIMQLLPSAKANYPTQKFWPTVALFFQNPIISTEHYQKTVRRLS